MIDRTELLRMIMETNPGQSPAYVLEQYTVYLKGLSNIHGETLAPQGSLCEENKDCTTQEEKTDEKVAKPSLTCGYTKRSLVVNPKEAIKSDEILCCLCGKSCQVLTERHIATHNGLSREGYLKLCSYPADQNLMSEKHLTRMKANVVKAQRARREKKAKSEK